MGWYLDWGFRKYHIINPASGSGTNYQKKITVHFGAGTDNDENVYLNSKCLTNFGDVRITDSTGVTLLDYWIEEKIDSDYAIFWVEILNDLSIYEAKIYVYYGKPGASSIANGENTFLFFDDFEGTLAKWLSGGLPIISVDYAYSGIKSVKFPPSPPSQSISSVGGPTTNHAVHVHFYDQMSSLTEYSVFSFDAGGIEESFIGIITDSANYEYRLKDVTYDSGVPRVVGWHEFVARMSPNLKEFLIDGNLMPITGTENYGAFIILINAALSTTYWDAVFETKYINPEPSHGIWSNEQIPSEITTFDTTEIESLLSLDPTPSDDLILVIDLLAHTVEDPSLSLPLIPFHFPSFLVNDVFFTLLSKRIFPFKKEFILGEGMFPIIGGRHIVQTEGEET